MKLWIVLYFALSSVCDIWVQASLNVDELDPLRDAWNYIKVRHS